MVSLVQRILDLHKRLQTVKADHERTTLERQIAATDTEIDHLVYELYDLTPEEIAPRDYPQHGHGRIGRIGIRRYTCDGARKFTKSHACHNGESLALPGLRKAWYC
ncbi:MAG TPA: hypothetical protein PK967_10475 [Candidatus Hydrogenedentes bacterium]|nr:hypothetical protein [Candidatus Hydrogenedentota bacterium]